MKRILLVLLILILLCNSVYAAEPNLKFPNALDSYKYYILTDRHYLSVNSHEYTLAFSNNPIYVQRVNGYSYFLRSTGSIIYYTITFDNSGNWSHVKSHDVSVYIGGDTAYFDVYFLYNNYDLYYHSTSDIQGLIQNYKPYKIYENERNLRNYFTGWFNNVLLFKSFTLNFFIILLSVFCLVMFLKRFFYRLITS